MSRRPCFAPIGMQRHIAQLTHRAGARDEFASLAACVVQGVRQLLAAEMAAVAPQASKNE